MRWWPECGMEAGSPEARRAVRRLTGVALGLAMVTALGTVLVTAFVRSDEEISVPIKAVLSLAPIVPFTGMLLAFIRMTRHFDELIVRVQFEAISMTLMVSFFITFGWGQLQMVDLLPPVDLAMAWPLATFVYGACYFVAGRRYR